MKLPRYWLWWLFWFVVILGILSSVACGDQFMVGQTCFIIEDGAEPWDDLPEAVTAMQQHGPEEAWDLCVRLRPGYKAWVVGDACNFDPHIPEIRVRITGGPAVADDCLPHEFAHSWHFAEVPEDYAADSTEDHGLEWLWRFDTLASEADATWLARRHF